MNRKDPRPNWRKDAGIMISSNGEVYLTGLTVIRASCSIDVRY